MPKNKLNLHYVLRKNTNEHMSSQNKYYGQPINVGCLSSDQLAEHMASHGTIRNKALLITTLSKLATCVPELLSQGVGIQLDGLGTIYPSVSSKGAEKAKDYNPNKHVTGVHIRFLPWNVGDAKLTSVALKKRCNFFCVGYYEGTKAKKNRVIKPITTDTNQQGGGE